MESDREKTMISVRVWADEYELFKQMCRELRTTPTAKLNEFVRETGKSWSNKNSQNKT